MTRTPVATPRRDRFDHDLAIVGAGFAGLACARSAAPRGLSVVVLERQAWAGKAIHTTGLLVKEIAERWEVPMRLTRRIRGVRLYAPSLAHIDLAAPGYYFLPGDQDSRIDGVARRGSLECGGTVALRLRLPRRAPG